MKSYHEPIQVTLSDGKPAAIRWRNRTYRIVSILDYWIAQNKWWDNEEKRTYLLLQTNHSTMEVYRTGRAHWTLARIVD